MRILVTGGGGYIGSHTLVELIKDGHKVYVIDNFSTGYTKALLGVQSITKIKFPYEKIDILDIDKLDKVMNYFRPHAVIHFAGLKGVQESNNNPISYYENNITGTLQILKAMEKTECNLFLFSSSATVYGNYENNLISENFKLNPITTYGRSKLFIEKILMDWANSKKNCSVISLRYFNPIGAHPSSIIGEQIGPNSYNLLPKILRVAKGEEESIKIYGNDYNTRDGTGERDFIHIKDLSKAHLVALNSLGKKNKFDVYNIGTGKGVTVNELLEVFYKASGRRIPCEYVQRRTGDLGSCIANVEKAKKYLNWESEETILDACKTAWKWFCKNPHGYN